MLRLVAYFLPGVLTCMSMCLTWEAFQQSAEEDEIMDWRLLCAIDTVEHKKASISLAYVQNLSPNKDFWIS